MRGSSRRWAGVVIAPQAFAVGLIVVGLTAALASCQNDSRALDCASDAAALRELIASDQRTGAFLHEVDGLAVKGNPREAVAKIDRDVIPAAEHAKQQASAFQPRTRWGVDRKKDIVSLVEDRQKATATYADALRSEIIQRVVEQMERQTEIERRAVKVEQTVLAFPAAKSGSCDPP